MNLKKIYLLAFVIWMTGCAQGEQPASESAEEAEAVVAPADVPEATSLFGETLYRQTFSPERQAELEANLAEAQAHFDEDPDGIDNIVWLGRRLAYLWRYHDAIDVYSAGLAAYPDEPRLYRHRGHRYITTRAFDKAVADLERAAQLIEGTQDEVELDGAPNEAGIPTSTLHTNIYYHLGLAHYLQGHFDQALEAYQKCLAATQSDDMRVATLDWLYMTLRRLGRHHEADTAIASVHAGMELLENFAYHRRLLMYKGEIPPESLLHVEDEDDIALTLATQGYGVGNFHFVNDQRERAEEIFRQVVAGTYWPAYGYIAAEADLKRLGE